MKTIEYIKEIARINLEDYFCFHNSYYLERIIDSIDLCSYKYEHPYTFDKIKNNDDCMVFLYSEISSKVIDSAYSECEEDIEKLKEVLDIIKKFIFSKSKYALMNRIQELESNEDHDYPEAGNFAPSDIEDINEQIANINGMISLHDSSYKERASLMHYIKDFIPEHYLDNYRELDHKKENTNLDELNDALNIIEEHNSKLLKSYTNNTHCNLDIPAYENAKKKIRDYINR